MLSFLRKKLYDLRFHIAILGSFGVFGLISSVEDALWFIFLGILIILPGHLVLVLLDQSPRNTLAGVMTSLVIGISAVGLAFIPYAFVVSEITRTGIITYLTIVSLTLFALTALQRNLSSKPKEVQH